MQLGDEGQANPLPLSSAGDDGACSLLLGGVVPPQPLCDLSHAVPLHTAAGPAPCLGGAAVRAGAAHCALAGAWRQVGSSAGAAAVRVGSASEAHSRCERLLPAAALPTAAVPRPRLPTHAPGCL